MHAHVLVPCTLLCRCLWCLLQSCGQELSKWATYVNSAINSRRSGFLHRHVTAFDTAPVCAAEAMSAGPSAPPVCQFVGSDGPICTPYPLLIAACLPSCTLHALPMMPFYCLHATGGILLCKDHSTSQPHPFCEFWCPLFGGSGTHQTGAWLMQ